MNNHTTVIGLGGAGTSVLASAEDLSHKRLLINTHKSVREYGLDFLLIGGNRLNGLGTSGSFRLGCKAIEESFADICTKIGQTKHIWIIAGIAGGTGGSSAYLAEKLLGMNIEVGLVHILPLQMETNISGSDEACQVIKRIRSKLLCYRAVDDSWLWQSKTNVSANEYLEQYQTYIRNQLINAIAETR